MAEQAKGKSAIEERQPDTRGVIPTKCSYRKGLGGKEMITDSTEGLVVHARRSGYPNLLQEVHAMSTTRRLSSLLVATVFLVLLALMATFGVRSADAAQEPIGGCPTGYDLVTVKYVLKGAGLDEPDPSMDINGDGWTCLEILDTGSGTRATWHDNNL